MSQKRAPKTIRFKNSDIAKRYLITTEGCPLCSEVKKQFKAGIKDGSVIVTDVGDELGFSLLKELGIDEAPTVVIELKNGIKIIEM